MKSILVVLLVLFGMTASAEQFGGVGLVLQAQQNGDIVVKDLIPGAPAIRAGIRVGDTLLAVEEMPVKGKTLDYIVGLIRGAIGSAVTLTVHSANLNLDKPFTLIREVITIQDACFLGGNYNLRLSPYTPPNYQPTYISGFFGPDYVSWNIAGATIYATFKGEAINLQYNHMGSSDQITGLIHGTYVMWMGNNGNIFGNQSCIK